MRIRWIGLVTVVLVAGSMLDCGYALVGRSSTLPEDVRTIYVQALTNQTSRARVDQLLTQAIIDEFVTRQRFKVVSDRESADAILGGTVTNFRVRPVAFSRESGGRAREYEILIYARMQFIRQDNDEVLWKQDFYQFRETYEIEESAEGFFDAEDLAIEEVAVLFAETLVIDVLEGF